MIDSDNLKRCEELYQTVVSGFGGDNYVLFNLAQCFISGFDREKLRAMLCSEDVCVILDGLFIADEIGDLATEYISEFRILSFATDEQIRSRANKLLRLYG